MERSSTLPRIACVVVPGSHVPLLEQPQSSFSETSSSPLPEPSFSLLSRPSSSPGRGPTHSSHLRPSFQIPGSSFASDVNELLMQSFQDEIHPLDTSFYEYQPAGLVEEDALLQAIQESLDDVQPQADSESSVSRRNPTLILEEVYGILSAHADAVIQGTPRRIVVARSRVWQSAVNFFNSKRRITSKGPLSVNFVGDEEEEAVDQGGPRREFFRLLIVDMIKNSGMLQDKF